MLKQRLAEHHRIRQQLSLLACVVLVVLGLLGWNRLVATAHSPHPGLNFTLGAAAGAATASASEDCNSEGYSQCYFATSSTFHVNVDLNATDVSYQAYDALITYSSVTQGMISGYWPSCGYPITFTTPGVVRFACALAISGSPSSYTGRLAAVDFTCTGAATGGIVINLVHGAGGDTRLISSLNEPIHAEGEGTTDSITINCGVTPVPPTPSPTPTPTTIPHQGNIFPVAGGAASPLNAPQGVVRAPDGSLYVADTGPGHCQVLNVQQNGTFVVTAGTGTCGYSGDNGPASSAQLNAPVDLALDSSGNLYIADRFNHRVRKVSTGGTITTVAGNGSTNYGVCTNGSSATGPCLSEPTGVWLDSGNNLYIASWASNRVMLVTGGTISTFAGNGTAGLCADGGAATGACISGPWDVVGDNGGSTYISSNQNHVVRKVTSGLIATVAGNGASGSCSSGSPATGACLYYPAGIDLNGGDLYIASAGNGLIRRVTAGNIYSDIIGQNSPIGVAVGTGGDLYFSEGAAGAGRVGLLYGATIDTIIGPSFCGDGLVAITNSCLDQPADVSVDSLGNIYIADSLNHRVRKVDTTAHISTLAGKVKQTSCATDGQAAINLCLARPEHVAVSSQQGLLYVSDHDGNQIWSVNLNTGLVFRLAGAANGAAGLCTDDTSSRNACLDMPTGLAIQQISGTDQYLFVGEEGNGGRVLRVNLINNTVRTVVSDGQVSADVAVGTDGSLYIAEPNAAEVTRVSTGGDGIVDGNEGAPASVAGTGSPGLASDGMVATSAPLGSPVGVNVDGDGHLLISDSSNHRLWVVTPGTGTPTVVDGESSELIYRIVGGGSPTPGFCGDPNPTPQNARFACLNTPNDLTYDDANLALYFADQGNNRVRKIPSDCDADGLTDKAELNGLVVKSGLLPLTPGPTPGTALTKPCVTDTDGDRCTDAQEVGISQSSGGRRDPTNPWDYFNPTHDGKDRVDDILVIAAHYGKNTGDPAYSIDYDRSYMGPNQWNLGPPNGQIRVDDILAEVRQYNHDCS